MRREILAGMIACLALGIAVRLPANAQKTIPSTANVPELAPVSSRVVDVVDDMQLVRLNGNTHPMARDEFDKGAVVPSFPMARMTLVLKRSRQQEAALNKFMEQQLNPKSPNFHHWLEPKEFGRQFGPSEYDIQAVTNWLRNHGFSVDNVANGRMFIQFSGNAANVQQAFHTEIHHYLVNGEPHIANSVDPQIPAALSPVVAGVVSMHNFFARPMHHFLGDFTRDPKTSKWVPESSANVGKPLFTVPGSSPTFELISPYDFATIYNLAPLWTAGIDGTGQTVAIAGRSDVSLTDVRAFRSAFGLPAKDPVFVVNGTDPGVPSANDKVENTLDVEWSGAAAKNATIKFVTTASTNTSDGASASAQYIIDNNVAKVMSFSYGNCELAYGSAGNTFNNTLWQQGAAQGISEFVASGDQGSAACDGGGTPPNGAAQGLAVSGSSSTPYNIAVGGTDFDWTNLTKSYWSASNASNGSSALSYIPEIPWNGTCASTSLDLAYGFTAAGYDPEQSCQYMLNNSFDTSFVTVAGGTGGVSNCTTPSGTTPNTCSGGYAKPSWQKGAGVPNDGKRDVPDVSLFAASGALNDAYVICDSQTKPCNYTNASTALTQAVGGTSVASPAMAGIMALVNQQMGAPQGNANAGFYALAAKDNRSSCNSVSVGGNNACNFYDVTTDNNAVPCLPNTPNCTVHHAGDTVGILNGYNSTAGFDLSTGLGSVNAYNLVKNWASVSGAPAATLTPTSVVFPSTPVNTKSPTTQVVTVQNTGTAALTISTVDIAGANYTSFGGTTSCPLTPSTLAVGASCTVTLTFTPLAAGSLVATLEVNDNAGTGKQTASISGTGANATSTVSLTPATLPFANTAVGLTTAAQVVTLKNTGTATVTINSGGITITGTNPTSFTQTATTCGTSLAVNASCTISIAFKPQAATALSATLSVADNATGSPQKVNLTGTGTQPSTPTVTLTPTSLPFPNTIVGNTSDAQTVTLKNTGTLAVTISSIALGGTNATSFLDIGTCGTTLAGGASCSIYVAFKPLSAGALTGTLSVVDNAAGSPQKVTLTGTGTAKPSVTLSPTTLTFAATTHGTTSPAQSVTITNSGASTLNITSIAITGTAAASYTELNTCGPTLAPAANCTVYLAFKPTTTGTLTAALTIADNGITATQSVTLTGTGK